MQTPTSIPNVTTRALTVLTFLAMTLLAATAPAAAAEGPNWNRVISCESGGQNVESHSKRSSASGYFQFTDGTWKAYGGKEFASRAIHASRAEQMIVAKRAWAKNGLRDWAASRHCWSGKGARG
jgi:hypothetical protein